LLADAGDLDHLFATDDALAQLGSMSAATVDRYLRPARDGMRLKGIGSLQAEFCIPAGRVRLRLRLGVHQP